MNNTLIKGLGVIELLAQSNCPLALTEISIRLGVAKSHAHRLLQTLMKLNYVIKDDAGIGYKLSIKFWKLGSIVLSRLELRSQATPWMEKLFKASEESVHLAVLDGREVVYVDAINSHNMKIARTETGARNPAHCVAVGKAILAFRSEGNLRRMACSLTPSTSKSIIDPDRFLLEMEAVRRQGYAIECGEQNEKTFGVAAPIADETGHVIAAVGIYGKMINLNSERICFFTELVRDTALGISCNEGSVLQSNALALAIRSMASIGN